MIHCAPFKKTPGKAETKMLPEASVALGKV